MRVVGISDIGLQRKRNEDRYLIDNERNLFLVCDGMGGHKGGNVASSLAVDTINDAFVPGDSEEKIKNSLLRSIELANRNILVAGQADPELHEMGTTVTAAVIHESTLYAAHVGDSSLFIIRGEQIQKVSSDHTLAEQMLRDGLMKPEDRRSNPYNHVLTRVVGVNERVEADFHAVNLRTGDRILLCSDGLTDLLDEEEILKIANDQTDLQELIETLVKQALNRGGHDNITIVLVSV